VTAGGVVGFLVGCHGCRRKPCFERQKFVKAVLSGRWTMTETCQRFGISRQTGYEVMALCRARLGRLADASRAPRTHPNQSPPEVEAAVLHVRKARRAWGSKKMP
jgi:hypothetical protein